MWGWNIFRHLGTGLGDEYITSPEQVKNIGDVISVSAGVSHALALKNDGSVWAWGCNKNGELGNGSTDIKTEMTLGDNRNGPVEIAILQDVVEIAAGGSHALAVTSDGGIWAWGSNDEGQLGNLADNKQCVPQRIM